MSADDVHLVGVPSRLNGIDIVTRISGTEILLVGFQPIPLQFRFDVTARDRIGGGSGSPAGNVPGLGINGYGIFPRQYPDKAVDAVTANAV